MKENIKEKQKKGMVRDIIFLGTAIMIAIILISLFPDKREVITASSWEFFIEMIWILPAVMVLMGLFAVWVSKETVIKYLGETSGIRGIFLAILFGALPTGPLYVAFPVATVLIKKGAKISNIIIFLSAWACIKIPQEIVEFQFLGLKFMAARLILTIIFVVIMGLSIEKIIEWTDKTKVEGAKDNAGI